LKNKNHAVKYPVNI